MWTSKRNYILSPNRCNFSPNSFKKSTWYLPHKNCVHGEIISKWISMWKGLQSPKTNKTICNLVNTIQSQYYKKISWKISHLCVLQTLQLPTITIQYHSIYAEKIFFEVSSNFSIKCVYHTVCIWNNNNLWCFRHFGWYMSPIRCLPLQ